MDGSMAIAVFSSQMGELINQSAIQRANRIIEAYNGRTDAILFSEGLVQMKIMLQHMEKMDLIWGTWQADQTIDAFMRRVKEIDRIALKFRGNRPAPRWTSRDIEQYNAIMALSQSIFGYALPLNNVVPLLMEVNHG